MAASPSVSAICRAAEVMVSAPVDSGEPYRGIAIYQDRRAKDSPSSVNLINGKSASKNVDIMPMRSARESKVSS